MPSLCRPPGFGPNSDSRRPCTGHAKRERDRGGGAGSVAGNAGNPVAVEAVLFVGCGEVFRGSILGLAAGRGATAFDTVTGALGGGNVRAVFRIGSRWCKDVTVLCDVRLGLALATFEAELAFRFGLGITCLSD